MKKTWQAYIMSPEMATDMETSSVFPNQETCQAYISSLEMATDIETSTVFPNQETFVVSQELET